MYSAFAPVVLHYRFLEARHALAPPSSEAQGAAEWEDLHDRYSPRVIEAMRGLQGYYVKVGQSLAGRTDTLPPQYTERLRGLEDQCPARPASEVRGIIERSLRRPLGEVFSSFEERPLGTASIGQVHRARLRRSGAEVAVKVMDPRAEGLFRSDMRTAKGFCRLFAPEQLIILDEIERQFLTEFDYRKEAEHLRVVRDNMRPFKRLVKVPDVHESVCTREVLVMEYLPGRKLVEAIREQGEAYAQRQGRTFRDLEREMHERVKREGLPPPYSGPPAWQIDAYRWALRARDACLNGGRAVANMLGWPLGWRFEYARSEAPLNAARTMDVLMRVMGHQVLRDGYFNADPHAGNFLLLPDGRIGLIDFGQVKQLTDAQRLRLCAMYKCLATGDRETLRQIAIENGYRSKRMDAEVMWRMTRFGLDQDGPDVTGGKNVQQFMDEQYARDPWEKTDDTIIMPVRVSFMLRGVGLSMGHPVSTVHYWWPVARAVLREQGSG